MVKECKSDSTKKGASSKKKVESSRAEEERAGCSFSIHTSSMFAKSTKADSDIELWHKRIGHINLNKITAMKLKGVVIGLPTFKEKEIKCVCEACQFGK